MLRTVVKLAFSQRRKMMRNTLKSIVSNPEMLESDLFKMRPEQLSVQDFIDLTTKIEEDNA